MRIWDFHEYKNYLLACLGETSRTGLRKKLAEHIPVHTTFISQILKGRAHLSLEQAESVNSFFDHTFDEGEYFLLLVMKDRAGSVDLKKRFEKRLRLMRDQRLNIKGRLGTSADISNQDRDRFYSSYYYGAIHVLTGISTFKTVETLAGALKLPKNRVQDMVDFCLQIGVLRESSGELQPGPNHVHLGTDSDMVLRHHSNWRKHAMNRLDFVDAEDLHYSACVSLSLSDAFKLKDSMLDHLHGYLETIKKSNEEVAYVLNFDFYKLLAK